MPKVSFGPEILVDFKTSSSGALKRRVEEVLRAAIDSGKLPPGIALPSSRLFSQQLAVSRGLIVGVYEQLISEGYLTSARGSATRVALRRSTRDRSAETPQKIHNVESTQFDFKAGLPDMELFPKRNWLRASRQAINQAHPASLTYPPSQGEISCRTSIANYLNRSRATAADPVNMVICTGVTQGIRLISQALRMNGVTKIAVEDPSQIRQSFGIKAEGLEIVRIGVDAEGICVQDLWETDAGAVLITPCHQYPTGSVLSPARRARLIAWAHARNAVIIEDDYDAEYRYDTPPVSAMQGLDPAHLIYVGSVSKTLAPGIRLGWLVLPSSLVKAVANAKRTADRGSSVLEQLTLGAFIEQGYLDSHLRITRAIYKRRRATLLLALKKYLPHFVPTGIDAGLHVMIEIPSSLNEEDIVGLAASEGIVITGAHMHCTRPPHAAPALLLGYGCIQEQEITLGIKKLATLITDRYAKETLHNAPSDNPCHHGL